MNILEPTLAVGFVGALRDFVNLVKLHPILVDFTAALVPVSVACDIAARARGDESLRHTAWWTLLFATWITPFTAIAGWLFWMHDDNGHTGMTIHKWLGTSLVFLLIGLFFWRRGLRRRQQWATGAYIVAGLVIVALLVVQGALGGAQTYAGP